MARTLWLAAVLVASLSLPALAGDTTTKAGLQVAAQEGPATEKPFTMEDARKLLMSKGYTNISELVKDESGKWVGSAVKDGKTVPVAVDVKGNVAQ